MRECLLSFFLSLMFVLSARGADPFPKALRGRSEAAVQRGLAFLQSVQQNDGGWKGSPDADPAITALATQCFAQDARHGPRHPVVRNGRDFVLRYRQQDGGIYVEGFGLRNYYTSVCLMMLAALKDPDLEKTVVDAKRFLKKLQWDEQENIAPDHSWYGGTGYGKHKRPDLSNTQMMLEALHQSGLPPSDPTFKKALKFIERCQMASESNDQPFARQSKQGGFIYTAANGGESKAGTVDLAGRRELRSYGSMTYAGFKSLLYANVGRDDPRIQRALDWIGRHYTLDHNPNMPGRRSRQGLYYYYHVFARAMAAYGQRTLTDSAGIEHNWRTDLCTKLLSLQNDDGSWHNPQDRWQEGNRVYVTSLAILALQAALAAE